RGVRRAGRSARALRALAGPRVGCYRSGLMMAGRAVRHARHGALGLPDDSGGPSAARALRARRSNVRAAPAARPRPRRPGVSAVALGLPLVLLPAPGAEVRVLSGPGAATTVTVAAEPGVTIEDRTPGAKPAGAPSGSPTTRRATRSPRAAA